MKRIIWQVSAAILTIAGICFNAYGYLLAQVHYCTQLAYGPYGYSSLCKFGGIFLAGSVLLQLALLAFLIRFLTAPQTTRRMSVATIALYVLLIIGIAAFAYPFWGSPIFLSPQRMPDAGFLPALYLLLL